MVELSVTGSVFGAPPHGLPAGPHPLCDVAAPLAAGVTGLGAPAAGGVAVAAAAGWAGLGAPVPAGVAVVSAAGLAVGDGFAPADPALPCTGAALGAGCAGFGAVLLSALGPPEPPDPLDGALEEAAGFGALADCVRVR